MAPSVVGTPSVTHGSAASTTYSGTYPTGIAAGELLFAHIYARQTTATAITISTVPTGWTLILQTPGLSGSTGGNILTYWKAATGSETGTVSWVGNASVISSVVIARISGADTSSPISGTPVGQADAAATGHTIQAVSPTAPNCLMVVCFQYGSATFTTTFSGSMAQNWGESSSAGSAGRILYGATEALTSSGSSGTRTATVNATVSATQQSIAIAPAAIASATDLVGMVAV